MRLTLQDGHVDLQSGDVVRDAQPAHRLREKERQLLAYLSERAGEVVARGALYCDIWGYHPQTRSRTLDSTVRRLRKAIEQVPRSPRHVLSVPGEGYRFVPASSEAAAPAARTPAGAATPYLPRPHDEQQLTAHLEAWRVVTVVGPGGVGKSRVAHHVATTGERPVVAVAIGSLGSGDLATLTDAVGRAAGMSVPGVDGLASALQRRGALVLLDEAEVHPDAVASLVEAMGGVRFLITSRHPLGREDEAVHQLTRLGDDDGAAFLRQRLAASRWGGEASDAEVAQAVRLLDGLPLALELAAAHPDGLAHVIEAMHSQQLPDDAMAGPLQASLARLEPAELDLLRRLALCEGALRTDDLVSWLGPPAREALMTLVDRSLVERRGRGWGLLRTTRVAVRATQADWAKLRRELDGWLGGRAIELAREIASSPGRASAHFAELAEDIIDAIPRQPPTIAPWLGQACFRYADYASTVAMAERIARATGKAAPDHPMTRILEAAVWWVPARSLLAYVQHEDAQVRQFAIENLGAIRPDLLDPDHVAATANDPSLTRHQSIILQICSVQARSLPAPQAAEALQRLLPSTSDLPAARAELLRATAEQLRLARQPQAAVRCLDEAIDLAERHNPSSGYISAHMRARALGDLDPARGRAAHLRAVQSDAVGVEAYDFVRAGILAYVLRQLDDARAEVGTYLAGVQGETRVLGEAVLVLVQARQQVPGAPRSLPGSDDPDDSPNGRLRTFLAALLASELACLAGQPPSRSDAEASLRAVLPSDAHTTAWQLLDDHLSRLS